MGQSCWADSTGPHGGAAWRNACADHIQTHFIGMYRMNRASSMHPLTGKEGEAAGDLAGASGLGEEGGERMGILVSSRLLDGRLIPGNPAPLSTTCSLSRAFAEEVRREYHETVSIDTVRTLRQNTSIVRCAA